VHRSRFHHLVLVLRFSAALGGWEILAETRLTLQEEIYFVAVEVYEVSEVLVVVAA
jgi:hypothetical protein